MDASYIPIAEARGFTTHWINRSRNPDVSFYIFMNSCLYSSGADDHLTEHVLDLLSDTIFIEVCEEQSLIGKDWLQLILEGFRFSDHDIAKLLCELLIHRVRCKLKFVSLLSALLRIS